MIGDAFPAGWRVVPASVPGPSHLARGLENQDAYGYRRLGDGYVVAVADGVGSRPRAATGARLAVEAACDAAGEVTGSTGGWGAVAQRYAAAVPWLFDRQVAALAGVTGAPVLDYATTLLAVLAQPPRYVFVNAGDGFLVARHAGGGTHLVGPPDDSPEGTGTAYLGSGGMRVRLLEDADLCGLALCTDGLIEAVLGADQWPDGSRRLLAPSDMDGYFEVVSAAGTDAAELSRRLQSPEFAATSPDDKTMVLVVRR